MNESNTFDVVSITPSDVAIVTMHMFDHRYVMKMHKHA
jgi:hypothetical protein